MSDGLPPNRSLPSRPFSRLHADPALRLPRRDPRPSPSAPRPTAAAGTPSHTTIPYCTARLSSRAASPTYAAIYIAVISTQPTPAAAAAADSAVVDVGAVLVAALVPGGALILRDVHVVVVVLILVVPEHAPVSLPPLGVRHPAPPLAQGASAAAPAPAARTPISARGMHPRDQRSVCGGRAVEVDFTAPYVLIFVLLLSFLVLVVYCISPAAPYSSVARSPPGPGGSGAPAPAATAAARAAVTPVPTAGPPS